MKLPRLVAVGCLSLFACGRGAEQAPLATGQTSALESAFQDAADEFQVPVGLLKAIAYVETRASEKATSVSPSGAHGLMALVERDDWKMLSRAGALTGLSPGQLTVDARANVRGAAAVLRELADASFRKTPNLDPHQAGDWFHAVSLYPGYTSASGASDYAAEVFLRMEQGFEAERVRLLPTATRWREHASLSSRKDSLGGSDYPNAARFTQSPHYSSSRSSYEFVVIHTMQGSYSGSVNWFLNPSSQVSAHYLVRSSDGEITQMVHDNKVAWHAQCYNGRSIGIEHEGFVQDPGRWYTASMYEESAKLTRWLTDRYNIPRNRTHIIGHVEVAPNCNTGGHTDPGGGWNWSHYMNLVNGGAPTQTTGVLTGAIYTGGDPNNRVAGAVVTVSGQSQTTAADGLYQFSLPPGAYSVNVAKAGFSGNTVTRTVTAGGTIWGSMEINGSTSTGVLRGKVYAFNASNPSDLSASIDGAQVTVSPGGATATTGADGNWSFNLAPGTYTVTAAKAGFAPNAQTRMVVGGQTAWGSVGLTASNAVDQQKPSVAVVFPMGGAQLDLAVLDVKGTASDDRGALSTVKLALNGGVPVDVPVSAGAFGIQVKLKPGSNTLTVTARDAAGNVATADSTVTFNAGVAGFVYVRNDESARVAGASVELLEPATGQSVARDHADASGSFGLSVTDVPKDYKVVVRAPGFSTHVETLTVGDDRRAKLNVSLSPGGEGPADKSVTFAEPLNGATVTTDRVTVYGAVHGFEAVSVTVNGVAGETLGGGGFTATVPLVEGPNTLVAEVKGVDGETVSATLQLTRRLTTGKLPDDMKSRGGCSMTGGLPLTLLALGGVALMRRRRTSALK